MHYSLGRSGRPSAEATRVEPSEDQGSTRPPGARTAAGTRRLPGNLRGPLVSNFEWKRFGEGNEASRGPEGVGAGHRTFEVGEAFPGDPAEGEARQAEQPQEGKMTETKGSTSISTKQERIAELAKRFPTLTTLSHHIDEMWLSE